MSSIVGTTEKEEWIESEQPAIQQLQAMGYEYKNRYELNNERKDFREVLLYNRLKMAIRKHNPFFDDEGVNEALSKINESNFLYTLDPIDTNERIRATCQGQVD